jgi:hypothetical protein
LKFFYFSSHKLPKQQSTNFWSQGILGVKTPKLKQYQVCFMFEIQKILKILQIVELYKGNIK